MACHCQSVRAAQEQTLQTRPARSWEVAVRASKRCAEKAERDEIVDRAVQWADAARTLAETAETLKRV